MARARRDLNPTNDHHLDLMSPELSDVLLGIVDHRASQDTTHITRCFFIKFAYIPVFPKFIFVHENKTNKLRNKEKHASV